ncbi:hypothetical protein ACHAW5_004836 [Stephanodiscus triporus]|uniref:Uncharacterized protein n=1 Tax=Stephanodiscus triporus TaxID=2934178 RepID=A0ABD3MI29_9STRA
MTPRLSDRHRRSRPAAPRRGGEGYYEDDDGDPASGGGGGGSVLGASLLFAGTAVGAGAVALPAETADAGFGPSAFGLFLCWAYTYVTSLVTLEASWLSSSSSSGAAASSSARGDDHGGGGGAGFLSISRMSLGPTGEAITAALFWFLLTAIIVAYTSEGGALISRIGKVFASADIDPAFGSSLFAAPFACLAVRGTSGVDAVNRVFVFGLVVAFVGLVVIGLPNVEVSNLTNIADWGNVYPRVISIGILSLGAQNVVPTLLQYLDYNTMKTRSAILLGSLLPLVLYTIWEAIFLGVVDPSNADGTKVEAMAVLGRVGGSVAYDLAEVFSFCAIGSSMAGASVSLVDFFQDGINMLKSGGDSLNGVSSYSSSEEGSLEAGNLKSRILATALALGPPVVLAYAFPDLFLVALEEAGLLGGVSLYGIIPAISILSLRHKSSSEVTNGRTEMPGRLGGGNFALIALVAVSLALVFPEIRKLL